MRTLLFISTLVLILNSCSSDNSSQDNSPSGKNGLINTISNLPDSMLGDKNAANNEFKITLSADSLDKKLMTTLNGTWRVISKNELSFLNTNLNYSDTITFEDTTSVSMTGWGKISYNNSVSFYFSKGVSDMYEYHVNKDKKLIVTQIEYRNNDLSFKKTPETKSHVFLLSIINKDKIELKHAQDKFELIRIKDYR
jgi:hypothetical protein